ncbi:hypothetical protein IKL64_05860 [bacterium]|nr:hypothetical protein [bacterium]
MAKSLDVKEYEEIDIKDCDLSKLQSYIKCQNLTSALQVTPTGVKANSWVGVIKYKKIHIQILPKLICDKDNNNENILKNLIFMLSFTKKLDIKTSNDAKLASAKNPFIEILIREFANSLFDCLKRLTPKKYVREEDNLSFLKGKLKFSENIRYNCTNQSKFYCEFDEFSEDNELNQLFLFVSTCLYNISQDRYNKKILKFIMNYYSEIKFIRFDKFNANKIKLTRNQELFKKPLNLAKMFIEQTSVDLSKNKFENITLIWDMNKLFEEFVFELINKYKDDFKCEVKSQKGRKLLRGDHNKKRNTYVDIMVKKGNEKIVVDTKYKKFRNANDFSNADVFQVSTYCLLHNAHKAILLYPQWDNTRPNIDNYFLNTDEEITEKYEINFKTINLKHSDLKSNLTTIKDKLAEILK